MKIMESVKTRLDPEKEYIALAVRSINQNFAPKTIQIPLSTGESFFANGHVQRLPRGEVDARFVPRRGTVNNTIVDPPVPARVPLRSMRVPKGVGAILVVDYLQFLANLKETQQILNAISKIDAVIRAETAKQDLDMMEDTLTSIQLEPQAVGARLRAASMVKTARRTARKSTRIRGWSRT